MEESLIYSDDLRQFRLHSQCESAEISARNYLSRTTLSLELGETLPEVRIAFETYGQLNARKDNAVLVCHALSGDSHVASLVRRTAFYHSFTLNPSGVFTISTALPD